MYCSKILSLSSSTSTQKPNKNKNWLLIDGKKNQHTNKNENPWIYKYFLWHLTCISGSIASPKENAIIPRALKALKVLREELPCKL